MNYLLQITIHVFSVFDPMLLGLTILLVLLAWMLGNTHTAHSLLLDRSLNRALEGSSGASTGARFQAKVDSNRYWQWISSLRRIELQPAVTAACSPQVGVVKLQCLLTSHKSVFGSLGWISISAGRKVVW